VTEKGTPVLVALGSRPDIAPVVSSLRAHGMKPIVALDADSAVWLLSTWEPPAAVVAADLQDLDSVLRHSDAHHVPLVLVGTSEQVRTASRGKSVKAALLTPAEATDIAEATLIVLGGLGAFSARSGDELNVGEIRVDLARQRAFVEDEEIVLQPKQFAILVQLAMRPGEPVSSAELIRQTQPGDAATAEDIRRQIYLLRRSLRDEGRPAPLIRCRRGYGYLLDRAPSDV
jgi:DNA-binding response OmpR family regulator